jgi:hypothetical protein
MIDRRSFIAATASVTFAPMLGLSPSQLSASEAAMGRVILTIDGWSAPDQSDANDTLSIRINRSWRTAWR